MPLLWESTTSTAQKTSHDPQWLLKNGSLAASRDLLPGSGRKQRHRRGVSDRSSDLRATASGLGLGLRGAGLRYNLSDLSLGLNKN